MSLLRSLGKRLGETKIGSYLEYCAVLHLCTGKSYPGNLNETRLEYLS